MVAYFDVTVTDNRQTDTRLRTAAEAFHLEQNVTVGVYTLDISLPALRHRCTFWSEPEFGAL